MRYQLPQRHRHHRPGRATPVGTPSPAAVAAALVLTVLTLVGTLTITAAPSRAATVATCTGVTFNGQQYCPGSISGVTSTSYGIGARIVLQNVSVTARSSSTVTVQALESSPCPPGYYCGATLTTRTLSVTWKGQNRPSVGLVINLYGTTIRSSLSPTGYAVPTTPGCYIDFC